MSTATAYGDVKLYDLFDVGDLNALLDEVHAIVGTAMPGFDFGFLDTVYEDTISLFKGNYPGFRSSTTTYHNLQHTVEVLLATTRLLHGASISGLHLSPRHWELTMCCALFHDVGLIQEENDNEGTGAKFTIGHENRSVSFMKQYFRQSKRPEMDVTDGARIIECTCLGISADKLSFDSAQARHCGQILATADLLAQMADREYLEKILLLYLEFAEAGLPYDSPHDLLEKTHGFYEMMNNRMDGPLNGMRHHALPHFIHRWDIHEDLYDKSIQANMAYLYTVLEQGRDQYFDKLKRGGIVKKIEPLL